MYTSGLVCDIFFKIFTIKVENIQENFFNIGQNISDRAKGLIFASLTALMWAVLAIFLKFSLKASTTMTIVWFRFAVAFILLFLYLLRFQPKALQIKPLIKPIPILAVLCLAINYWTYLVGVDYTSPSNAQIVIQLGPMILALSGVFYFHERLSFVKWLGITAFFIGFFLFYLNQYSLAVIPHAQYTKGVLIVVVAAAFWSVYAIIQKQILTYSHPQSLNLIIDGFCALAFLPFVDFASLPSLGFTNFAVLLFLGVNTVVAYGCMSEALQRIPANQVSVIIALNPLLTILVMQVLKYYEIQAIPYEVIGAQSLLGALLIILGAILVVAKIRFQRTNL